MSNDPVQRGPGDHRWCDARIAELESKVARVGELEARLNKALARIADLERRLGQNSSNSSRPPSTDPPSAVRPPAKPSGRKPGGQPGHEPHLRVLLSRERVTRVVVVRPSTCPDCGKGLKGKDPSPRREQVVELPVIQPDVTEFELHTLECGGCGKRVAASRPTGVATGAFGPRLQAAVSVCTGVYHMSKRAVGGFFGELLGIEISLGSVSACETATSEALAMPVEEAREYVQKQPVVNADETGWREGRKKAWLWTAVTPLVAVFHICRSRGQDGAKALLGFFKGMLITDQWNGYHFWSVAKRQLCWAHLKRHFTELAELGGTSGRIGKALLAQTEEMFGWWHRVRDGTLSRATFQRYMGPLRKTVEGLLRQGAGSRNRRTAGKCAELLKRAQALWTFVRVENVEPTNNAAERAIRPCVLWRKGSFGTHSAEGSRFMERIMTVRATLRLQRRSVLEFVIAACEAKLHGHRPPSLLPKTASDPALARVG